MIELKYNRSLRAAQEQADRKRYGRSLLAELANTEDATCIALHLSKSRDGEMRIEGARRARAGCASRMDSPVLGTALISSEKSRAGLPVFRCPC